jgi:hypothetical protein
MTDHEKLGEAVKALGWTDVTVEPLAVSGKSKNHGWRSFERGRLGDAFVSTDDVRELPEIQRKYAEVGVRKWARSKGFAVESFDGRKMTLVNRRS